MRIKIKPVDRPYDSLLQLKESRREPPSITLLKVDVMNRDQARLRDARWYGMHNSGITQKQIAIDEGVAQSYVSLRIKRHVEKNVNVSSRSKKVANKHVTLAIQAECMDITNELNDHLIPGIKSRIENGKQDPMKSYRDLNRCLISLNRFYQDYVSFEFMNALHLAYEAMAKEIKTEGQV